MLGLLICPSPRPLIPKHILLSHLDHCGARCRSGVVHDLVGQCHRGAIWEGGRLIAPLQEKGQQLPLPLHKDGPPPHKAEAVLSKDGLCFFHHLQRAKTVQRGQSKPRPRLPRWHPRSVAPFPQHPPPDLPGLSALTAHAREQQNPGAFLGPCPVPRSV